jgi:hypothetical protein
MDNTATNTSANKEVDIPMTATEAARLADWLTSKGMTAEEVIECIHYIANEAKVPEKKNQATQHSLI